MTHVWQAQTRGRFYLVLMRHPFCRYTYQLEEGRPSTAMALSSKPNWSVIASWQTGVWQSRIYRSAVSCRSPNLLQLRNSPETKRRPPFSQAAKKHSLPVHSINSNRGNFDDTPCYMPYPAY